MHKSKPKTNPSLRGGSPVLTIPEAAEYLGIGVTMTYQLIASGDLRTLKFGKLRRATRDACDKLIARRENEAA